MERLKNSAGQTVTLLGGSTSYITVSPFVSGTSNGNAIALPLTFGMANYEAFISGQYLPGDCKCQVIEGPNSSVVVRIDAGDTVHSHPVPFSCTLTLKCNLMVDLRQSMYRAGDTVAFRWAFILDKAVL